MRYIFFRNEYIWSYNLMPITIINPINISKERYLIIDFNRKLELILINNFGNSSDEAEKKNNDKRNFLLIVES